MWESKLPRMVTPKGKQKGMKTVFEEREINVKGLHTNSSLHLAGCTLRDQAQI